MEFDDIFDYQREKGFLSAEQEFFQNELLQKQGEVDIFVNGNLIDKYDLKPSARKVFTINSERAYVGTNFPFD